MSLSMEQYSGDAAEDTLSVINANKLKEIPKSFPRITGERGLEKNVWGGQEWRQRLKGHYQATSNVTTRPPFPISICEKSFESRGHTLSTLHPLIIVRVSSPVVVITN